MPVLLIIGGLLLALIGSALTALRIRSRYTVVTVEGTSMAPTLSPGDQVVVERRTIDQVRPGDIVVLQPPRRTSDYEPVSDRAWNIKRAAALPGDRIPEGIPGSEDLPEVPDGMLVVLGDNPDSIDSRHRGFFEADRIMGVAIRRLGGSTL
ncbi:S26 family signal peptidase [Streptomyces sp. NPDC013953]|uniref:S26 family signal peptidase n=1 Tax=Streptomyces sp. NPDC013953 TaxID=3364868 RepID=UPI0036F54AA3